MKRRVRLLLVAGVVSAIAAPIFVRAQAPATLPSFDVASVKPNDPNDRGVGGDRQLYTGGRIVFRAATLQWLIMQAYGLQAYQLSGGPSWVSSQKFNIEAEPPANSDAAKVHPTDPRTMPPPDELLMLRSLLESRFQLVLSKEERDGTVYSLEPVAGGIKRDEFHMPAHPDQRPLVSVFREDPPTQEGNNYHFAGNNATMAQFAAVLEQRLSAPVKDNTGLAGSFDFVLQYSEDDSLAAAKYPVVPQALQEQFGLRLKSEKGPVDHYVIARAEQPSAN
jgi:uncharacterized protein (TIGR03435 family)